MTDKLARRKAYTYEQAAAMLSVGKDTIRDLVARGELLSFCVSSDPYARSRRISDAELDRFIAARVSTLSPSEQANAL